VESGVGIFTYTTKPDASIFGKKSVDLDVFMDSTCDTYEAACQLPDVLQIVYTFNFPEACEQFRKLFYTDFYAFNAYQFTQASNQVNVNVNGFGQYVLRCPFLPKALSMSLDADAYAYTLPVAEVSADADSTPPYTDASSPNNAETITGRVKGNAMFRHGYFSNYMKQFMLMSMGIRVEFNCDNVVVDQPVRTMGVQSSNIICNGTQCFDTPLQDLRDCNQQLSKLNSNVRYVPVDNCQGSCDNNVLSGALAQQVAKVPNNCSQEGDGVIPLPCIPLLPGMGIDIVLYTLPGLEQSRDDLLSQACNDTINPGHDLPAEIVATNLTVLWVGTPNSIFIVHNETVTQIGPNEPIPLDLLTVEQTVPGVPGTFVVKTKFPYQIAPTFSGTGVINDPGTVLVQGGANPQIQVLHTEYPVGSRSRRSSTTGACK
jgi:hypothetical protein